MAMAMSEFDLQALFQTDPVSVGVFIAISIKRLANSVLVVSLVL